MTTAALTTESTADEYRQTSACFMQQAEVGYAHGEMLQACEKSWGSLVQQLKALATIREMPHHEHWALRIVARQIVEETGQRRIGELFDVGQSFYFYRHEFNRYERWMLEDEVRARMDNMKELIDLLKQVPPPSEDTPIRRYKGRPFFRDRGHGE